MKCINCQKQIPADSKFCLNCGAAQPQVMSGAADSGPVSSTSPSDKEAAPDLPPADDFDWMAREFQLRPDIDYEAARRFDSATGQAIGCVAYIGFAFVGFLALLPGVPLMSVFGWPLAIVLGVLTYFNVWRLQEKLAGNRLLKRLPGFAGNGRTLAIALTLYLLAISAICLLIMVLVSNGTVRSALPQY